MTRNHSSRQGVSAREAGRQLNCSHTYLLRLAGEKRVPRHADGTFDVAAVRAALALETDPAQVRGADPERWSQRGNGSGNRGRKPIASERGNVPADPQPDPAAYRTRGDLPDDFARGALYGLHAAVWHVPRLAAENAQLAGLPERQVAEVYAMDRECVPLLITDALEAIGVLPPDSDDAGLLNPLAFDGYCPVRAK